MKTNRSFIAMTSIVLVPCNLLLGQAVVSLEVYAQNGVPIPGGPVATIDASPGDVLELIFRLRDWGTTPPPNRLRGYQCAVQFDSYFGGCHGNVLPEDFYATTDPEHVCPDGEPEPEENSSNCFIDNTQPMFVFSGHGTSFLVTSSGECRYRWAGALLTTGQPNFDTGVRYYLATLIVRVSDDAAGVFVVGPDPNAIDGTLLRNQNNEPILPILFESCAIIVGDLPHITATNPPSGAIDARQPHSVHDANALQGWDSLAIHFNEDCNTPTVTANDFTVSVEPPDVAAPIVTDVAVGGYDAVLQFDSPIPAGHWTRVTYWPNGTNICLGSLPGDVDNNRTASPVDILKLIDALNSLTTYQSFQTDIDRSGVTNPADILREIDLLNGADAFESWNWRTLPPNPCLP